MGLPANQHRMVPINIANAHLIGGLGKKMGHDHLIVATPSTAAYSAEKAGTSA